MNVDETFARAMRRAGWAIARSGRHLVWRCPCGRHQVVTPSTMGEGRSYRNNVALVRRQGCPSTPKF